MVIFLDYDYLRRKIIVVNKSYPEETSDMQTLKEADNLIDPHLYNVFIIHDLKIMETRYRGTWGFMPSGMVKKTNPIYKKLMKTF